MYIVAEIHITILGNPTVFTVRTNRLIRMHVQLIMLPISEMNYETN